ncbi:MAG: UDP-N-acetylmuramoyl-L-alanine--D-glutamate ligase [Deltaproteobacteria bacterium]|nr:UDP-N-acetylmuramoyl-L-alanine--D-glutamate ligase [Deltaproteobacteria bacterium]MBN2674050.1 UDP-N-acetylmuramoyl-L-alanine--D-glutamate ligase [Deltaproteobacteria bacterium]
MRIEQTIEQLKNKKIGVLGVGVEGRATIEYLLRHGVQQIEALDKNEIDALPAGISFRSGDLYMADLARFDVIFKSPGFRPDLPSLQTARDAGTKITSAVSFFMEHCPAKVIGITGTVGKGTASSIVAKALEAAGFTVHLGGNIGKSPLTFLDDVQADDRVVLELSSFQTMDISVSPKLAGILKTTTEHLDWHRDTEEYRFAKSQLLRFQTAEDIVVYNADAPASAQIAECSAASKWAYSLNGRVNNGVFLEDGRLMYSKEGVETALPLRVAEVRLAGRFNLENIASAVLLAHLAGGDLEAVCAAAEVFEGLPNRLELAARSEKIRYYNDSYATRPDAAAAAIAAFDAPLALVMGGSEKNADFAELTALIFERKNIVSISLIGATAERMFAEIQSHGPPAFSLRIHETLAEAMNDAQSHLQERGGVLLMAPACASFGLFKNYKERGEQFVQLARKLAAGHSI